MKHSIITLFLLFVFGNLFSSTINGTYKPFSKSHIYAFVDDDFITNTPNLIAETNADENGKFTLSFSLPQTQKVWIKTSQYISYIYVVNGLDYDLDLNLPQSSNTLENKQFLIPKIKSEMTPKVNREIFVIDSVLDNFYTSNYLKLVHPRAMKPLADTLKKKWNTLVGNASEYANTYAYYAFAPIDDASGMRENYFYKHYTSFAKANENLIAYYKFISEHYKSYFETIISKPAFGDASKEINEQHNCISILQKMNVCDTILKIDSLKQLLFLNGLQKLYYKREFKKSSIEMMLRYMAFNSTFTTVRKVSKNILAKITKLSIGTAAPEFALLDAKGDTIHLSAQKGKLVYLCFTNYSNIDWQTHLPILERLQLLYDKRLQIITITLGKDFAQLKAMQQQKKISGLVLNGFDNFFLKDDFLIDALPKYMLVDADGDVLKTANCSPVDGVEDFIKQALKK